MDEDLQPSATDGQRDESLQHNIQRFASWARFAVGLGGLTGVLLILGDSLHLVSVAAIYLASGVAYIILVHRSLLSQGILACFLLADMLAATYVIYLIEASRSVFVVFYAAVVIGYTLMGRALGRLALGLSLGLYGLLLAGQAAGWLPPTPLPMFASDAIQDPAFLVVLFVVVALTLCGIYGSSRLSVDRMVEHAQMQQRLVQAEQEAREIRVQQRLAENQRLEALGRLAGGVAHDFNNQLTVIQCNTEEVAKRLEPDTFEHTELQLVVEAAGRAAGLTRQLLDYSREREVKPVPVDVGKLVGRLHGMLTRLLGASVEFEVVDESGQATVMFDPAQLEHVVVNLAVNARDAMPGGGRLEIRVAGPDSEPALAEFLGIEAPDGCVTMTVSDSGQGMDEATRARIFEPFFTTKALGQGTGLGLASVFGSVRQAGGHIDVESKLGEGTTFRIVLPHDTAEPVEDVKPRAERPGGDEIVLLVEDEEPVRRLTARILRRHGYNVLEATDGTTALELICGGTLVDLLLTDLIMPGMPGDALAQRFADERPGTSVLYMTGYAPAAILDKGIGTGQVPVLQKPFSDHELLGAVRQALDMRAPPACG